MFWLRALILAGTLTGSAGIALAEEYPPRWSPALSLNSLDDLERRVQAPLWNRAGIILARRWRYVGQGQAPDPVEPHRIVSCADYWAADLAHLKTGSQSDHNLLGEFAATCTALNALRSAQSARKSFVSDFRLDERAADVLPAGIAIPINPVEQRDIDTANAKGWSWRQWHGSRKSGLETALEATDGSVTFEWTRVRSRMEILASGDFSGDGVEDLLLRVSEWPGYAHASRSKALLVTRQKEGAPRHILSWPRTDETAIHDK